MTEGRDPLTRPRSPWVKEERTFDIDGLPAVAYKRNVHDGFLSALISIEPHGVHLSVAHHNQRARRTKARRYPSWDEIAEARYSLCPGDIDMVMILPPLSDFVAEHPTTFHLHQADNLPPSAVDRDP